MANGLGAAGTGPAITALFFDLGGVLLTNGWDRHARERAAVKFNLDRAEVDERHHLTFDTYEEGEITLDEYLDRVVFYEPHPFTRQEFRDFMFAQSQPMPQMIDLARRLKARYGLKIAAVSNEGRELAEYRIQTFHLTEFIDFFIVSSFVGRRKPDRGIFCLALDVAQTKPEHVAFIEDRAMFVEIAKSQGMHGIRHTDYKSTRAALEELGLLTNKETARGNAED